MSHSGRVFRHHEGSILRVAFPDKGNEQCTLRSGSVHASQEVTQYATFVAHSDARIMTG